MADDQQAIIDNRHENFAALFTAAGSGRPVDGRVDDTTAFYLNFPEEFPRRFFVLSDRGRPVARIGASVSRTDPDRGFIGFFATETDPGSAESAAGLIRHAVQWLRRRGIRQIYGPVNFATWFPYRLRTDPDSDSGFPWEPKNPPEYPGIFTAAGGRPDTEYLTRISTLDPAHREKWSAFLRRISRQGYTFEHWEPARMVEEAAVLHHLTHDAFTGSFLFEPLDLTFYRGVMQHTMAGTGRPAALVVRDEDGEPAGFLGLTRENEAARQAAGVPGSGGLLILKTLAVARRRMGAGLGRALMRRAYTDALEEGLHTKVLALMRSDNFSTTYDRGDPVLATHHYHLYRF